MVALALNDGDKFSEFAYSENYSEFYEIPAVSANRGAGFSRPSMVLRANSRCGPNTETMFGKQRI